MDEATVARMLRDPDETLRVWYRSFMSPEDDGLVLTGLSFPSGQRIGEMFDQWCDRSRDLLRDLLCEKLRYARLEEGGRELAETSFVATVATLLATSSLPVPVDPLATAALLLTRRRIDKLCAEPGQPGCAGVRVD